MQRIAIMGENESSESSEEADSAVFDRSAFQSLPGWAGPGANVDPVADGLKISVFGVGKPPPAGRAYELVEFEAYEWMACYGGPSS